MGTTESGTFQNIEIPIWPFTAGTGTEIWIVHDFSPSAEFQYLGEHISIATITQDGFSFLVDEGLEKTYIPATEDEGRDMPTKKNKILFFCQNCGHQSPKWL